MTGTLIWAAFLARVAGTGFVVVAISWIAARMGPKVGGIVVGLPIVLAPGFGFMLLDHSSDFVAQAAAGALFSLAATQIFLLVFFAISRSSGPAFSVGGAAAIWALLALPLSIMPHHPVIGAGLFIAVTIIARKIGQQWAVGQTAQVSGTKWRLLVLRGLLAGLLVGMVTLGATAIGPAFSGAIMAFPIGFTVIGISLHLDHGGHFAGQTAYAGLNGLYSLAGFCLCLALLMGQMAALPSFILALSMSVLITLLLMRRAQRA
ncbi:MULTISPECIES: hypothetical protein [unclassified Yoonia]|uniref:hypothetical protein n=1 Tax=unclassified Yoonia TaxID=2629118 RepID=UPI002AFF8D49|nr:MULTISPECIES: hypothetical protein [unclassified Yoonia]